MGVARRRAWALTVLALLPACADASGLIVERVGPESAAERAGLRPGDRLVAWEQEGDGSQLQSAFELAEVEVERAPRGRVRLRGDRQGQPLDVSLSPDDWRLDVRPELPPDALAAYEDAARRFAAGDVDGGVASMRRLASGPLAQSWMPPWLLRTAARAAVDGGRLEPARALLDDAASSAPDGVAEMHLRLHLAQVLVLIGGLDEASMALARALELARARDNEGLGTATVLVASIGVAMQQARADPEQLAEARAIYERRAPRSLAHVRCLRRAARLADTFAEKRRLFEEAVSLSEQLTPDGLELAVSLFSLAGWVTTLENRAEPLERALAIQERLAPESQELAQTLSALAIVLAEQGDTAGAVRHARRAVAIIERRVPGSFELSRVLNGLGIILDQRGDFAGAEATYRRALALSESLAPGSFRVAVQLQNLGITLQRRGDLAAADTVLQRALAIAEKQTGQKHLLADCLVNLGIVARDRGDYARAEEFYRRTLEIHAQIAPELVPEGELLLADVRARQHKPAEAETLYRKALEGSEARQPLSDVTADAHKALGELALERGELDGAQQHLARALAIREQRAPDSQAEAEAAHALGLVARRRGRSDEALALFERAVVALEAQGRRLGGAAETSVRFRARYQQLYRDLENLLLELGRREQAFATVERSRATGLLALMAARDLDAPDVPAELLRERRRADQAHGALLKELTNVDPADETGARAIRARIAAARAVQADVRARVRAVAPRAVAWRDPQPLDAAGAQSALEPGTVALVFSLGERRSHVYALGPGRGELAVFDVVAGEAELRADVRRFREHVRTARGLRRAALLEESRKLGDKLLGPAREPLARAARVLVVPDGPLHLLPFAALGDPGRAPRLLIESKAVHVASSLTLHAELGRDRRVASGAPHVVGFADPAYTASPPSADADPVMRGALGSGLQLVPLPGTRDELHALKRFAPDSSELWLGADATEERAKALDRDARIVHFACHGFADAASPLESGLVLSIPKDGSAENGILQAWEVFESVRLDADLVTLSACETGLGQELAGEGLLGLTWAFEYAGARSVLASLWEVNDRSTAALMRRFYLELRRGTPKDEALRRAQVELLRAPGTIAPFFWAAFQLVGDRR